MDLEKDFTLQTIALRPDYEGEVVATLISCNANVGGRPAVLYLHGYVDYFFQPHMAQAFIDQGVDFYALDLRKYGRSIRPHQHANYCEDMAEYFEEVSFALKQIDANSTKLILLGHSTGGLLAASYMNDGEERSRVETLILNSPFLEFNQSTFARKLTQLAALAASELVSYSKIEGAISPAYCESVHRDFFGEWNFDLEWKPIKGFPTYFKWLRAIAAAHKKLHDSQITVPTLVMHSSRSLHLPKFTPEAMSADIVLNIEDIKKVGAQLGDAVTLLEIKDAMHDIFLSPQSVRDNAFAEMFAWLKTSDVG